MKEFSGLRIVEKEKKPRYRLMITRHAERLPSGVLSAEGIQHARDKGKIARERGAGVLKAYVSDHKSNRAFDTGELISESSDILSGQTEKHYRTHKVPDIQYEILKPDLYHLIGKAKDLIEEATLKELGWSTERDEKGKLKIDIEKIPVEEQEKIAPTRQKNQRLGFEYLLSNDGAVHRMAIGLAHQLLRELKILDRYLSKREGAGNPPTGDVVLNNVSHGLFSEALLKKTGVFISRDGERTDDISDLNSPEFGGYIQPGESWSLIIDNPSQIPELIPVEFEEKGRVPNGEVFIDRAKLEALSIDYDKWKKMSEGNRN